MKILTKIVGLFLLVVSPLQVYAMDEHSMLSLGGTYATMDRSVNNIPITGSSYAAGIMVEQSFTDHFFWGIAYLQSLGIRWDAPNTTDYVNGSISTGIFSLGGEKELGSIIIQGILRQQITSGELKYHSVNKPTVTETISVTGLLASLNLVIPLSHGRFTAGFTSGLTGDYSNAPIISQAVYRVHIKKGFMDIGVAHSKNVDGVSLLLGTYF